MLLEKEEIWKDIKGFEGLYQVSNLGRFKSLARPSTDNKKRKTKYMGTDRILNYKALKDGYQRVNLVKDSKVHYLRAHRLISEAFIPNPENKPHINHINGVRDDNRLENLEWVTHQENAQHAHDTGLCNPALGEKNGKSKLTSREVLEIKVLLNRGVLPKSKIAKLYSVSNGCIARISNETSWAHVKIKP
jgi:hypothetical protein